MKYYNLEKLLKNIVVFSNNDLKLLDDKYNSAKVNSWLDSWYIKKLEIYFMFYLMLIFLKICSIW